MNIEKLNNGFYRLGDDEYRVEAPMREPSTYRLETVKVENGRDFQHYVTVTSGRKLRSNVSYKDADGNFTEPEPTIWHLYKMKHFKRDGVAKTGLDILNDNFIGTAKEAIAACEAHKAGG